MDSDKENDSTPQDSPDMTAVMQNLIQKGENSFFLFIFFFLEKIMVIIKPNYYDAIETTMLFCLWYIEIFI